MTVAGHHVQVIAWNEPGALTLRGTVVVIAGREDLARARLRSGTAGTLMNRPGPRLGTE